FKSPMWITPLPPSLTALGEGSHGSILNGNYPPNRLSSAWKPTLSCNAVMGPHVIGEPNLTFKLNAQFSNLRGEEPAQRVFGLVAFFASSDCWRHFLWELHALGGM
ncbi:hypothetical protein, partial [Agrobacterium vitis]|uniref:hypothetical protein n=1 Tax=Agrobacterium vitis TaxID=373 RepID=UPI001AEE58FD